MTDEVFLPPSLREVDARQRRRRECRCCLVSYIEMTLDCVSEILQSRVISVRAWALSSMVTSLSFDSVQSHVFAYHITSLFFNFPLRVGSGVLISICGLLVQDTFSFRSASIVCYHNMKDNDFFHYFL